MSEETKSRATEEGVKSSPDLKALREERGLTIEDIFRKTRINPAILNAIENGEFHLLPAPPYAKRFIESYANTIGIDARTILALYQRHLDVKQAAPEGVKGVQAQIPTDRKPSKRYLLYAVSAVAITATAFIIYTFLHQQEPRGIAQRNVAVDEKKEVVPKPPPAVKERPPEPVENVPRTPPPALIPKETTQPPKNAGLNLLIEATEDAWLRITEDHKRPQEITLKAGEKFSRTAREFFIVDVGNAAGVNITFQGKPLGSLGSKGQVVHLRLPQQ